MTMRVAITGSSGFIGDRVARVLLGEGPITLHGRPETVDQMVLVDRVDPALELRADPRVSSVVRDLSRDPDLDFLDDADLVFHLAAALSGDCERDFELGLRTNVFATLAMLERCRRAGRKATFVFASSVAVFGPPHSSDDLVDELTLPRPQSSYGAQKLVCEQLVAEYSRKGFLTGRAVRLMTVCVRPGRPNGAASGFLSSIVREPLSGVPANCPVQPADEVAIASPDRAVEGLLRAASARDDEWGSSAPLNLPSLRLSVSDMVAEVERRAPDAGRLISWLPDEPVRRIIRTWPTRFDMSRAAGLGLFPDPSFAAVVDAFVRTDARATVAALSPPLVSEQH